MICEKRECTKDKRCHAGKKLPDTDAAVIEHKNVV